MPGPGRRPRVRWRRTTAAVALVAAAWVGVLAVAVAVDDFPRGLLLLLCAALVAAGAWEGVLRRGWGRVAGLAVAGVALAGGVVVLSDEGYRRSLLLLGLGALVWHATARLAFRPDVVLPAAARPQRPVVVVNPRSGDGRAARVGLVAAAAERGIAVVELRPGDDLAALAREAVDDGADALAMAGGDGSQAVVAAVAAEARRPLRVHPLRHPQPLRPRPGRRPGRRGGGARRPRRRRRAGGGPGGGERPGLRQQRLAGRLRRGRAAGRVPGGEAAHAAGHGGRLPGPGRRGAGPDAGPRPAAARCGGRRWSWSATTSTGWPAPPVPAPGRPSTTACSG